MSKQQSVIVRFPMSEEIWDKVFFEGDEDVQEDFSPESGFFCAEYANQEEFNKALVRFEGMVEYEVLSQES